MRRVVVSILMVFLSSLVVLNLESASQNEHGITLEEKSAVETKQLMQNIEEKYLQLQIITHKKPLDYEEIEQALEQMKASAKRIRKLNENVKLDAMMKGLDGQIQDVITASKRNDKAAVNLGLEVLHETCFSCHTKHAPRP